ncbi:hypothetical protein Desku_1741 [Desulfofundulus kuznetsovii DSM 6115]|uniref:Nudix hydrolase domain-containing protein n=1 Tax=Desulfofundulus kuznetsovii (strain DSM 6115 / VKM B-1805 / 17) TaxID=760568 RepID=A0AAU8PVZ6_DESK7|nr:hypothetical protein Desku_1741 [Desulfofundulus kuznetsovii DSM 6115]
MFGEIWALLRPHIVGALIGTILTFVFEEAIKAFFRSTWRKIKRLARIFVRKRTVFGEEFMLGKQKLPWIVIDGGHGEAYDPGDLECRYVKELVELPEEVQKLRKIVEEEQRQASASHLRAAWNGSRYYLHSFVIDREPGDERSRLKFIFGPSDYYNFLATSPVLDRPLNDALPGVTLRSKYLKDLDPWSKPVSFLAHSFGINLAVITRDEYMVFAQRSPGTFSRPGYWNVPVNEGLQRPFDNDETGAPDFFKAAARGLYEELGISLGRDYKEKPKFVSFGLDTQFYQFGLLGFIRIQLTLDELLAIRASGVKDKWEAVKVDAAKMELDKIVSFVRDHEPWAPSGLVCIFHTLVAILGKPIAVHRAFEQIGVKKITLEAPRLSA